ncbi:GNAT family N-acetyltransferase [Pseudomonas serbica]|jgi:GNAT superfamily N-acetyltransferase|uniref:GNAT family N-acetyltransferase n=1 Tax=Pseudomonas serbica TaxID=2965074 RepID=UPI00237ABB4B|nr:GNAT family N-acetyltransferase [Pseudomonas serbica]
MAENKLQYALSCDRLRVNDDGDQVWHTLMAKAERITFEELSEACELSSLLEDGETLDDYISVDDWAGAYKVETDAEPVVFLQRAGFELFFTHDGQAPTYVEPLDRFAYEHMMENGAARVLLKPNDARIGGSFGFEGELVEIDYDLDCVMGDRPRFRLYRDGEVVAGLRIDNGVVDSLYVHSRMRRHGLATELFNRAQKVYGHIEHSTSLNDDGKAFRASFDVEPEDTSNLDDEEFSL